VEAARGDASDKTTQGESRDQEWPIPEEKLRRKLSVPSQGRLYYIRYAMKMGWTDGQIHELTNIDPWFLAQMRELVEFEDELTASAKTAQGLVAACKATSEVRARSANISVLKPAATTDVEAFYGVFQRAKQLGYSDIQLSNVWHIPLVWV